MKCIRAVLCALLLLGVLSGVPAHAGGWKPKPGGTFNVPRAEDGRQYRIHKQIVGAIRHARKGSTIRISLFSFDRKIIAEDLIAAHRRGVRVQVLLNDHQVTGAQRMLHRVLGRNPLKDSFAYECTNGCRSSGENLHTKFFLFTHTGSAHDVVMTGSVNFTMNSVMNQYNDVFIRNESPLLHTAFVTLFDNMRLDKRQSPSYWTMKLGEDYKIEVTPYPNFGPASDPMMEALSRVHCFGATGGTGSNGRTVVRVIMHAWNDSRGHYLAKRIRQLYAEGCDVRVMYGFGGEAVRDTFASRTPRGYVPVHTTGYDTNEDGFLDLYTHQKELLVSGNYGGDRSTRMVVTGSSNWNNQGLRGDELIFTAKKTGAYRDYIDNFRWMWAERSHRVRYIAYKSGAGYGQLSDEPTVPLLRFGPAWEND